ncbi:MAG TPA: hypothetical protein VHC44_03445, partial [Verrucomicrobiae bacterium]|nr:hypothetical protein [Verrucomicrobiae bacterium]
MTTQMYTEKKSGRGCLFWGGITAAILFLLLLFAGYGTYRYVKWLIAEYTDTKPLPAPAVLLSHSEITNLQQRVHSWDDAIKHNRAAGPLTLSAEEINALIAGKAKTNGPPARLFFSFESNQVQAQLSVPTDGLIGHWLDGRYLNGSGNFDVSLHDGHLLLRVQSLAVKGRPLPENFMQPLRGENFADSWTNDPDFNEAVGNLEEIK